jgi:hydroxypyruvate isomerase
MKRRTFITKSTIGAASSMWIPGTLGPLQNKKFNMKFSPEFGIFEALAGKDSVDQIRWGYDQGFTAWENTMLKNRSVAEQQKISDTVSKLGMQFGQFVGTLTFTDVTFAGRDAAGREKVLQDVRASVDIAKRMNTKFIHNVLGLADPKLPWDFQMANAIDLLKRIAEIYEPHGLIMVMESMNHKIDHPGMFLHNIPQAYSLAKAVGSPSVKVLFDFYHVQIQEGNLLPTFDYAWDEIAYVQVGDTPGRKEPTSGEINYPKVLQYIHDKGYRGFVGMEHGIQKPGKEGAMAALQAYRSIDPK